MRGQLWIIRQPRQTSSATGQHDLLAADFVRERSPQHESGPAEDHPNRHHDICGLRIHLENLLPIEESVELQV